jgi:hypothetical protein
MENVQNYDSYVNTSSSRTYKSYRQKKNLWMGKKDTAAVIKNFLIVKFMHMTGRRIGDWLQNFTHS